MLFKLKQSFYLILILSISISCHSNKELTGMEKSAQYKERLNKKKKKENEKNSARTRKRQYDIQAESTKKLWDSNQQKSDQWRKKEYFNKPLSYKIRIFFDRFKRDPKPKENLFSKKELRKRKKSIFQRIFKREKKRK